MYSIEEAGLLKFDFLGIRNLSILGGRRQPGQEILRRGDIDLENIPLDDKRTFRLLALGQTEGLFQLNGAGMTRYLKELRPTSIHDINAMVALSTARGPMESIPEYIKRKHNPALVSYLDPRMKKIPGRILRPHRLPGTTCSSAPSIWPATTGKKPTSSARAVGKKIPAEMAAQYEKFTKGRGWPTARPKPSPKSSGSSSSRSRPTDSTRLTPLRTARWPTRPPT